MSAVARAGSTRIALVGMPGAGKTTLGVALARALALPFVDSDRELERRFGAPVASLFHAGDFRAREAAVIDALTRGPDLVLATGGGAVLRDDTRARLGRRCYVIHLASDLDTLWRRTRDDASRPLLDVNDPRAALAALHDAREALYRACAHCRIETSGQSVDQSLAAALDALAAG
ncbi:shikimate kinase [Burkholderia ubonensis]|uniref:shikimate kinase n=1 Tax=Burkholderia ubonensis TaxID=101571 RepID=UPI000A5CD942|nr:shikimate kinase [Burkholderia ubonensis]